MKHIVKESAFLVGGSIHKPLCYIGYYFLRRAFHYGRHCGYLHCAVIAENKLYTALLHIFVILVQRLVFFGRQLKLGFVDKKL